ncbi:MAG TPA: hypothetical protein VFH31_05740 [Pyrinomonadaceae bacterium]|nr:hypothetical protein [Pyrinomonadaceae bacterium]
MIKTTLQLGFLFTLLLIGAAAQAQVSKTAPGTRVSTTVPASALANSRNDLISAAEKHKSTAQELLLLQETELKKAQERHEQLRPLVADGLIARMELEKSESSLNVLRARLEATRQQIADSDKVVAEVRAMEESAKSQALLRTSTNTKSLITPTIFRYNGSTGWSLGHLGMVQSFFSSTFGRLLPTSTVGQSATHNRLGWDHRHAVDVALHPDSAEGRALIGFLQSKGIPFLAFRGAIPGVSTGPHIHIGAPSHRLG